MASSMSLKLACVVLLCLVVGAPLAQGAITCGQVTSSLFPCLGYMANGGAVSQACCNGIRTLNSAAKITPDHQVVCKCIKTASGAIPGLNANNASRLPGKCGVSIPYKISPSTDCKTVR